MRKPATKSTASGEPAREPGEGVAAVDRALSIVTALENSSGPMTLADLAAQTGCKSTILRLLGSLIPAGYVTLVGW